MKEFQDKFNALIALMSAEATNASLCWTKDGVIHSLGINVNGGSVTANYSAYQPTPTPPATVPAS